MRRTVRRFTTSGAAARRGASLLVCLILLPLAVGGLTLAFVGIDVQYRETARGQGKAQARLLAESAMARFLEEPTRPGAESLGGELDSAGRYRIEKVEGAAGVYAAIGEAPLYESMRGVWDPERARRIPRPARMPRLARHRIEFKIGTEGLEILGETKSFVE